MIGKCWCGDWHQISITLLLVNCHDVTGGIFEWWILRKTGMKSPLKWHSQAGKNTVMLMCYNQRSQLKLPLQFQLSFHSFDCFYGTVGLSLLSSLYYTLGEWLTDHLMKVCQTWEYTAISRKVVRKIVHATIPKGNMGYNQYTVPDIVAVENTFVAFL